MKSCFEGCCLEEKRCKDVDLSSRGMFASFEVLALEALTDMRFVAHLAACSKLDTQVGIAGKMLLLCTTVRCV